MKYFVRFLTVVLIILFINIKAQIPNSGFETWVGGIPQSWLGANLPGYETLLQSNFAHSGQSALNGKVVLWPGFGLYPPAIYSDLGTGYGFPITQGYNSLKLYYAFKPNGGDVLYVNTVISDANLVPISGGFSQISAASDNYVQISIPIDYPLGNQATAAYCLISIGIAGPENTGDYHEGSEFFIDDLELSMDIVSGVESELIPARFELNQNFPNPFNPATVISYQLPENSFITLKVFDILGNEVAALINEEQNAGNHNYTFSASNYQLPSGIYFYQLRAGDLVEVKKMMLVK